ncbi:unnamed protein product [Thlaspi arvense]|uniref:Late embryogenesis abundant protein LEA-2 subgroup domain-containing protein n=1 Tax=Thlaspi arvense TaxID=13288 RepID=A0AAU9R6Z5_THLAR|nr:unnamed protein product [Thlaspi arvense]
MAIEDDEDVCVSCCVCGCNCITTCICLFVAVILNIIGLVCIASLLVWMMLRSNAVKFQVHDAVITRFDLENASNSNLHYNISLNFAIRNSNSHIGIHYDELEAMVYYSGQRLASVSVPSFYQGHKSTKALQTVFQGQHLVLLSEHGLAKFEDGKKLGVYEIDVKLRIKSRVLFLHLVTWPMKPTVRCRLKVPLDSSSKSSGGFDFQSTKCHLKF